ncbi:MAG: serine/threonine protein kinase, partial [Acidobacteriales bacterium]|nr:serine/threonine protein kinase [Terriglobales bacterium]
MDRTSSEWLRIRDILGDVLDLPPEQRPSYLDNICASDQPLRARLEDLIRAHESAEASLLDTPLIRSDSSAFSSAASRIGQRFGAYRIEAQIASGGMGTVFRAVRADDEYNKQVAIKLVSIGAMSQQAAELFRRERQVLAGLEHPNIARLLDGGTTPDGVPYIVLEYVDGQRVTSYAAAHALSVEQKLNLFLKVCSAVQYAHQHLVIHRDIKPANILVTPAGEPKLLDFGIAKIVELDASGQATMTALQALTPEYASPEQLLGKSITTATDVYSLALVLYELLTGVHPFASARPSPLRLQQAILDEDPEPPSRAVLHEGTEGSKALAQQLRGDLDCIINKATRKTASERYPSVEQFTDDLRRHLENLPVLAQPDTLRYRATKLVRRHKTAVLSSAFAVAILLCAFAGTAYEAHVARVERTRAEQRFNDVRKLANALLFEIHDSVQDLPGSTPARKLIAQRSLEYLDSLSSEQTNDIGLLRELATAYERVGELQGHYLANNL